MATRKAKILMYDLEMSPNLQWAYGVYQPYIQRVEQYGSILSFSYAWFEHGKKPVIKHESLVTVPVKMGTSPNKALTLILRDLMDEADVVMAHNAYGFDNKTANALFAKHDIDPPSPYKTIDTLRIARAHFRYPGGNRLTDVARYLGVGTKTKTTVADLWYDCLKGSAKAWKLLKEYNNQDIVLLHGIYLKMLPFIKNHPNLGDIVQADGVCPKCLGDVRPYGSSARRNGRVVAYKCNQCGGRCNEATLNRKGRLVNAV